MFTWTHRFPFTGMVLLLAAGLLCGLGIYSAGDARRSELAQGTRDLQDRLTAAAIQAEQGLAELLQQEPTPPPDTPGRLYRVAWHSTSPPGEDGKLQPAEHLEFIARDQAGAAREYDRIGADPKVAARTRAKALRRRARLLQDDREKEKALRKALSLAPPGSRAALFAFQDLANLTGDPPPGRLCQHLTGDRFAQVPPRDRAYLHQSLGGEEEDRLGLEALANLLDQPQTRGPVQVLDRYLAWQTATGPVRVTLRVVELKTLLAHILPGFQQGRWQLGQGQVQAQLTSPFPPTAVTASPQTLADLQAHADLAWRQRALLGAGGAILLAAGAVMVFWLQRRQQQLEERKRNFILAITHELKTPVGNIRLFADTIGAHAGTDPQKIPRFAAIIAQEAERLRVRIDQALAVAAGRRPPGEEGQRFAPAEEVVTLGRRYARQAKAAGLRIACSIKAQDIRMSGSPERFATILDGLLGNAIKFSTPRARRGDLITITLADGGDQLLLQVEDQGPGIPPGEYERVFEPFLRLGDEMTREVPGTGLGLTLVRKLVEEMGGTVTAGRGSRGGALFTVTLPLHKEE